jgi:hypothetical protein
MVPHLARWIALKRLELRAVDGRERRGAAGGRQPLEEATELGAGRVEDVLVGVRRRHRVRLGRRVRVEVAAAERARAQHAREAPEAGET